MVCWGTVRTRCNSDRCVTKGRTDRFIGRSRWRHPRHAQGSIPVTRSAYAVLAIIIVARTAAAQARPASSSAEARHADSLYDRRDFPAAARAYRIALAGSPNDGRSWYRLGTSLAATNDNTGAAEAFE